MYFVKITLITEEEEIESASKDFENAEDAKNAFDDSAADLLCTMTCPTCGRTMVEETHDSVSRWECCCCGHIEPVYQSE